MSHSRFFCFQYSCYIGIESIFEWSIQILYRTLLLTRIFFQWAFVLDSCKVHQTSWTIWFFSGWKITVRKSPLLFPPHRSRLIVYKSWKATEIFPFSFLCVLVLLRSRTPPFRFLYSRIVERRTFSCWSVVESVCSCGLRLLNRAKRRCVCDIFR